MFKKKKDLNTPADRRLKTLYEQFLDVSNYLNKSVRQVIVKKEIIEIYPEGADKDKAIEDYKFEQQHLLALIGEYDDLRNQVGNLIKTTKEKRNTTITWHTPQTSHERIEQIYKIAKGM